MSHTHGPWTVEQCNKHDRYNYHIRNDVKGGFALVEDWAEATLIAAAPELLAVAEKFRDVMKENENDIRIQTRGVMDIVLGDIFLEFDAAIAKARGEL